MGTTSADKMVVTSVKIERGRLDALKDVAASERRTISQEIRWLIDRRIAEAGKAAV